MRSAVDFIREKQACEEASKSSTTSTWLLLGKGPSFDRRREFDLSSYLTLGLNHVALLHPATLNHYTDLDAFLACAKTLVDQGLHTVLPWFPHIDNRPGKVSLSELSQKIPSLMSLRKKGLLLTYNSTLARKRKASLPTIRVRLFSAVAGLNLLAAAGVKKIRSLGIDGGSSYAQGFNRSDLLANGRSNFDSQFEEMRRTVKRYSLDYRPLVRITAA